MNCKICGQDRAVVRFQRDDPVLECGHLQAADEELLLIERTAYRAKRAKLQKESEDCGLISILDRLIERILSRCRRRR